MIRKTATGKVSPRKTGGKGVVSKPIAPNRNSNGGRVNKGTKAVPANGMSNALPPFTITAQRKKAQATKTAVKANNTTKGANTNEAKKGGRLLDTSGLKASIVGKDIQERDGSWTIYDGSGMARNVSAQERNEILIKKARERSKYKPNK